MKVDFRNWLANSVMRPIITTLLILGWLEPALWFIRFSLKYLIDEKTLYPRRKYYVDSDGWFHPVEEEAHDDRSR